MFNEIEHWQIDRINFCECFTVCTDFIVTVVVSSPKVW